MGTARWPAIIPRLQYPASKRSMVAWSKPSGWMSSWPGPSCLGQNLGCLADRDVLHPRGEVEDVAVLFAAVAVPGVLRRRDVERPRALPFMEGAGPAVAVVLLLEPSQEPRGSTSNSLVASAPAEPNRVRGRPPREIQIPNPRFRSLWLGASRCAPAYSRNPAIVAVSHDAMAPPNIAFKPTLARSPRRSGARALMPPIWMPMEEKLAKPHSA